MAKGWKATLMPIGSKIMPYSCVHAHIYIRIIKAGIKTCKIALLFISACKREACIYIYKKAISLFSLSLCTTRLLLSDEWPLGKLSSVHAARLLSDISWLWHFRIGLQKNRPKIKKKNSNNTMGSHLALKAVCVCCSHFASDFITLPFSKAGGLRQNGEDRKSLVQKSAWREQCLSAVSCYFQEGCI